VTLPQPKLETPRLILRPPQETDLEGFAAFASEPETMTYLGGVKTRPEAWQSMAGLAGHWTLRGFGLFSVIEKESGRWIGRVGPLQPEGWPGPEVGWGIRRDAVRKGYAAEAAAAAIDWAFETLGWSEVIHCIDPANAPSIALAERLGSFFLREGRLPPPWQDFPIGIWGQSRAAWQQRRAGA
jgi:RimJ/RimL family protein N-acetyltransferase